jgi:hypothetical protein
MLKKSSFSLLVVTFFMASLITLVVHGTATSQQGVKNIPPDAKLDLELSTFMRKKLEASNQILEGLTVEDAELILLELSSAERFQVQHDVMYRQFSGEFQRTAKGLLEAAEKKNFDAAALKWMDTTMKCLECHKFVRGTRIAGSRLSTEN